MPILPVLALVAPLLAGPGSMPMLDVLEQNRGQALEHYRTGLAHMRTESWPEAEREFQAAVKLDPLMVMAHYGLGQSRMALKRYPEAADAFLGCREAHLRLAALAQTDRALADQRREDEIRELEESLRLFQSGAVKASNVRSMTLKLEARLQQLQTDRRRGGQTVEVPAEFSLALGSAYFRSGKLEDAEKAYREAIKVNAKMGEARNNLAVVYLMTGRVDEAEKEMKAAEKAGYPVNPRFKDDLTKAKLKAATPPR
jgi:tetratricopeptide (TPR) repeat protein